MLEWKSLDWFQQSPWFLVLGTFVMFEVGILLLGISIHNFLLFDVATVMNKTWYCCIWQRVPQPRPRRYSLHLDLRCFCVYLISKFRRAAVAEPRVFVLWTTDVSCSSFPGKIFAIFHRARNEITAKSMHEKTRPWEKLLLRQSEMIHCNISRRLCVSILKASKVHSRKSHNSTRPQSYDVVFVLQSTAMGRGLSTFNKSLLIQLLLF